MATRSVRIDATVLQAVLAKKPHYLDNTGYLSDLLAKTLDKGLHRVSRLTELDESVNAASSGKLTNSEEVNKQNEASVVSKDLIEEIGKKKFVFSVPDDLVWCDELLLDYWKEGKGGAKSERAAIFLFEQLTKMESLYGKQVVLDQLKAATAHRWESITVANYVRFGLPKGTISTSGVEAPRSNAGQNRDVTAERLEREGTTLEDVVEAMKNGVASLERQQADFDNA